MTIEQVGDVPVEDIKRFESEFLDDLRRRNAGLLTSIRETKNLTDDDIKGLAAYAAVMRRHAA